MKRILLLMAALFCFGLALTDAEAARLGGGRNSGVQRNNVMQRQATPAAPAPAPAAAKPAEPAAGAVPAPAAAVPPQPSTASRWLGPLAGLAIGAGLASMFMGGGSGAGGGFSGLLMLLLIASAAFFIYSLMRRRATAQAPVQYGNLGSEAVIGAGSIASAPVGGYAQIVAPVAAAGSIVLPAGFDKDGFLRQAKLNFMRLQAANDRKDLHDIRNFTTPEMYAEISLEAQERGDVAQQIDVTELNAELLDVTEGADEHLASVRFFGALREAPDTAPESFDEVWHLSKPADGRAGWLIAGIQQYA